MANNTEEWWSLTPANGAEVSLHQFGWSVTTVGGSRYDVPPRRGSNMSIAYRPGQVHRTKLPDARTITLLMFMVGWDPATGQQRDGQLPTLENQRVQWNDNWDALRRLVFENYLADNRVLLTRRWRLTAPTFPSTRVGDIVIAGDPGTPASGVSRLISASTHAEMSGSMAPTMTGRARAEFQMDFTLADPYFFGLPVTTNIPVSPAGVYVWNDGHDVATAQGVTVELVGPLTNPALTNLTTSPDSWVRYNGVIPAGQTVYLQPGNFTAYQYATGTTTPVTNRIASITSSGARMWVNVLPGANKFQLYANAGTGFARLKWQPPYI